MFTTLADAIYIRLPHEFRMQGFSRMCILMARSRILTVRMQRRDAEKKNVKNLDFFEALAPRRVPFRCILASSWVSGSVEQAR